MSKNLYIHIPFCSFSCSYCTFSKVINSKKEIHQKYIKKLLEELNFKKINKSPKKLETIYFGGGTPSLIDEKLILKILENLKNVISNKTEILMEFNPENISKEKLLFLKKAGITKISIGIQTFQKKFFNFLHRDIKNLEEKIILAKKIFPKLSIDLIFGFPNQTKKDLEKDLEILKKLNLEHISFYALDYKKGSFIEKEIEKSISFEKICEFYKIISTKLETLGFEKYEIYNFCKNKSFSNHNLNFWNLEDYEGIGVSAVSTSNSTFSKNTRNLKKYLEEKFSNKLEILNKKDLDFLFLQRIFRKTNGISFEEVKRISGKKIFKSILVSKFLNKKDGKFFWKKGKEMFFQDFFEEIYL